MTNDIKVKYIEEDMTTIRILKTTRELLQNLKKGNSKRNKGIDTYDDVLIRLINNE